MKQERIAHVRANMKQQGLTQILVSDPDSLYYLCGIPVQPMERLLVLYIGEQNTALFANAIFGLEAIQGMPVFVHSDGQDPVRQIADFVKGEEIGIDKFWPSQFLIGLLQHRKDLHPRHGSAPVDDARMCKDEEEIAAMRAASLKNDRAMQVAISAIHKGVSEEEIAAAVVEFYNAQGAGRSGEGQLVCFGQNGADPHHGPDRTVLKEGDSVIMDIFIPFDRYWCDMTRTVFYKTVSDEQRKVYETVKAANLAAEAVIRPGISISEVDKAARSLIEEAGYGPYFTHRLGHGAGLACHEPPDNSQACDTELRPGMVFSIEPGIYLPGRFGVRIEDLVLVTENGCEVLNKASKELQIIEA